MIILNNNDYCIAIKKTLTLIQHDIRNYNVCFGAAYASNLMKTIMYMGNL